MVDFARLRKNSSIENLQNALKKQNSSYQRDERYWKPETDKAGNGFAVIRFLPASPKDGDDAPTYVRIFKHFFKGPGGKIYSEKNRSTIGQPDPLSELNKTLWTQWEATGDKTFKDRCTAQKRKMTYVSNVLIVNDPAHPENNGKVFLFSYGVKIMDKLKAAAGLLELEDNVDEKFRDTDEKVKFSPFDPWEGANFKLKIRQVTESKSKKSYPNYDLSEFQAPSLIGDDDAIRAIWEQEHSLLGLLDPKEFRTYEELKKRLDDVLELRGSSRTPAGAARTALDVPAAAAEEEADVPTAAEADAEISAAIAGTPIDEADNDAEDFSRFEALAKM